MTPHYADDWLTVYHGDSRAVMAEMEPESVHCVVTSPPYWGLRDYGTATWLDGDPECDHGPTATPRAERPSNGLTGGKATVDAGIVKRGDCRCGARRTDSQLGLESTPEEYVANMVAVFREVRRVLRSDGTVWLNLGDSYSRAQTTNVPQTINDVHGYPAHSKAGSSDGLVGRGDRPGTRASIGLASKQLVGIPWRVAFALQADGWYLRSDIIWAKPNPMPESVTDRPTKSHEYIFLLSKSPRYYFDSDAVRESDAGLPSGNGFDGRQGGTRQTAVDGGMGTVTPFAPGGGRNIRSVWTIATAPYPGAHFATFPPKLVEPCIKAGTSERGVCPECGYPWVRIVEREVVAYSPSPRGKGNGDRNDSDDGRTTRATTTTGWRPSCSATCDYAEADRQTPVPATVLDPFAGSGTTGMVAQSLSRRAVLIDLSMDYLGQLMERNRDIPLGLGA
jgi:DNA modification methylase